MNDVIIFLMCNKVTVILPRIITPAVVSVSASSSYNWTETLPLQHRKRLQYRAHEAADEAALSQCAAHMPSIRCVSKCLNHVLWPLLCISCCVFCLLGQNPTCRRRYGDHQHRENVTFTKDAGMDVTRAKSQGQKKGSNSSSTANSDVILPKIVNRWQIWWKMMANMTLNVPNQELYAVIVLLHLVIVHIIFKCCSVNV